MAKTTSSLKNSGPNTQPKPPEPLFFKIRLWVRLREGEAYRTSWGLGKPAGGRGVPTVGREVPTVGRGARVPLGSGTPQLQVWLLFQEKEIENTAEEAAKGPGAGYLPADFRL